MYVFMFVKFMYNTTIKRGEKMRIFITGSTDGIGKGTAKNLVSLGHEVIIHGRNDTKVQNALKETGASDGFIADLTDMKQVRNLAAQVKEKYSHLDVLINNAGVNNIPNPITKDGLDARFVVNTITPYLLTKELLSVLDKNSRVVSLSSAAQATVDYDALRGDVTIPDANLAYAQSKLALTQVSNYFAKYADPMFVAVNPKSFIGTKMVKDAYGMAGVDLSYGINVLTDAAISEKFANANGAYYDNDIERFSDPHPDALDENMCDETVRAIEEILKKI